MRIFDLLKRAWFNLMRNKSRTLLAVISAAIGFASIMIMISVTFSVEDKVINKFIEDSDILTINANKKEHSKLDVSLALDTLKSIRNINGVSSAAAAGIVEYDGKISNLNSSDKPFIVAVDKSSLNKFEKDKIIRNENGVLVNKSFTKSVKIFDNNINIILPDPAKPNKTTELQLHIDETLKFDKAYLIDSIYKNQNGDYPPIIYLPMELTDKIINKNFFMKYCDYSIKAKDIKSIDYIIEELKSKGLETKAIYENVKSIKKTFYIIKAVLGALGTITLIVSAFGTMNIMNMAVIERKKEIGIIKAIGTKLSTIRRLFIAEAFYIGVIGSVLGMLLSYILSAIINKIFRINIPFEVFDIKSISTLPILAILIVWVITIFITLIASVSAVNKAVKTDTLSALREG
ncbi:efflux ABC transporter, permease protein [Clostridiales bacterium oral taxon 876 str. F0540]|nr:efflux ABC transporter, permease protein [Clostridiales bacterium oral taxon 876 str. F0540]